MKPLLIVGLILLVAGVAYLGYNYYTPMTVGQWLFPVGALIVGLILIILEKRKRNSDKPTQPQ
jgi:hypothetical protein